MEFGLRQSRPRLLFVVTEDWYFVSHRLALAIAAKNAGYDVSVATRVDQHGAIIRDAGIGLHPVNFNRGGMRPLEEAACITSLVKLYREIKPDIVHHVAIKPVLYGALAARLSRIPAVVNALGGLGYVFSSNNRRASIIRLAVHPIMRFALGARTSRLILQNSGDRDRIVKAGLIDTKQIRLIRGAGVDPSQYLQTDTKIQPPLVILPARLLRDKGVGEFIEAIRLLRSKGVSARFALVGRPDPMNPASFTSEEIDRWTSEAIVENWGWRDDMANVYAQAQIVCLPSYHEGLPKSLLEAAASGCAMVASDIPGCKEIVREGETGLLARPRDSKTLANALQMLIEDPGMRQRLGTRAKALVQESFSIARIAEETLQLYAELLRTSPSQQHIRSSQ
jgi:glycosyltransferase involved in cell wall biosynthesis